MDKTQVPFTSSSSGIDWSQLQLSSDYSSSTMDAIDGQVPINAIIRQQLFTDPMRAALFQPLEVVLEWKGLANVFSEVTHRSTELTTTLGIKSMAAVWAILTEGMTWQAIDETALYFIGVMQYNMGEHLVDTIQSIDNQYNTSILQRQAIEIGYRLNLYKFQTYRERGGHMSVDELMQRLRPEVPPCNALKTQVSVLLQENRETVEIIGSQFDSKQYLAGVTHFYSNLDRNLLFFAFVSTLQGYQQVFDLEEALYKKYPLYKTTKRNIIAYWVNFTKKGLEYLYKARESNWTGKNENLVTILDRATKSMFTNYTFGITVLANMLIDEDFLNQLEKPDIEKELTETIQDASSLIQLFNNIGSVLQQDPITFEKEVAALRLELKIEGGPRHFFEILPERVDESLPPNRAFYVKSIYARLIKDAVEGQSNLLLDSQLSLGTEESTKWRGFILSQSQLASIAQGRIARLKETNRQLAGKSGSSRIVTAIGNFTLLHKELYSKPWSQNQYGYMTDWHHFAFMKDSQYWLSGL